MKNNVLRFTIVLALSFFISSCARVQVTSEPPGAEVYVKRSKGNDVYVWEHVGQTPTSYSSDLVRDHAYVIWQDGTKSVVEYAPEDKVGFKNKKLHFKNHTWLAEQEKKRV